MSKLMEPEYIQGEVLAWMHMLHTYVPQTSFRQPDHTRVLDMGCGLPYEAIPLLGFFGEDPKSSYFIGVDNNSIVTCAGEMYAEDSRLEFHHVDGREIARVVDDPVDVLVCSNTQLRRPFAIGEWDTDMEQVLREAANVHRKDGLLFLTFYSELEAQRAVDVTLGDRYDVQVCQQNPHGNPAHDAPRHNYVLLGIRN